jgi:hypothetical protein
LPFVSIEEINHGYVWGMDVFFNARVENMRVPTNAATNHRVLNARRARWMYDQLQSLVG